MYNIEFYTNRNGQSEILNFLEALRTKSKTSKDARIQYNQIVFYIDLLAKNGSNLPIKITKHLEEDIWELRPGYVLLHYFRKKSQKTPAKELLRAKAERDDYIKQKEEKS